jgi:hypothetical protein
MDGQASSNGWLGPIHNQAAPAKSAKLRALIASKRMAKNVTTVMPGAAADRSDAHIVLRGSLERMNRLNFDEPLRLSNVALLNLLFETNISPSKLADFAFATCSSVTWVRVSTFLQSPVDSRNQPSTA